MTKQTPALAITRACAIALALFSLATLATFATLAHAAGKTKNSAASAASARQGEIPFPLPETTPAATVATPVSSNAPLKMTATTLGKVNPLFFGANFLYWLENKKELADGKIEARVKDLPITLLRYPGGTVADNFHWATTTLDNPTRFPYTRPADVPDMSTFDDFMAFCARAGAEPMLVVNTESWVLRDDIAGGIKEAADWVRYCKTKNYKVKYWEIGNETYWHAILTGREYGALVKRYSQAMKAVDPAIVISAVGHYDKDNFGEKEKFPRDQWAAIRQRALAIASQKDAKAFDTFERGHQKNAFPGSEKWWPSVLDECGKDIDMLSVHPYYSVPVGPGRNTVANLDVKIAELKKFAKTKTGRDYLVCASEYSCKSDNEPNGWGMAEGVCRMLSGGVDLATIWPLRYGGGNERRSVLTVDNAKAPRYPWQILKLFSDNFSGADIIKCADAAAKNLYLFAAKTPAQITLVVTARGNDKLSATEGDYEIAFAPDAAKGKVTTVCAFATDANAILRMTKPAYTLKPGGMTLHIVPGTFTMILIKR